MRDAAAALDRRDEVEEAVRQLRAIDPKNVFGRFGCTYALAYGRADEARAALTEIVTRWPEDGAFAQQLLPWALENRAWTPGNTRGDHGCARETSQRLPDRAAGRRRLQRRHQDSWGDR